MSKRILIAAVIAVAAAGARGQNIPTAVAHIQLYGWAGFAANFSGVALAKNGAISAGADIEFHPFFSLYPAFEVRGLYPIDKGNTVAEKNVLAGLRLGRHVHPFSPYGDILIGRGELDFAHGGYPTPDGTFYVVSNTSNVVSFGAGTDASVKPVSRSKATSSFSVTPAP